MANWKHTIDFIGRYEKDYEEGYISLGNMAKKISDEFENLSWISDEDKVQILDGLFSIVDSYVEDPDYNEQDLLDEYDYWKDALYNWADDNSVWISPTV